MGSLVESLFKKHKSLGSIFRTTKNKQKVEWIKIV
jgi:hypothetical protein